MHITSLWENLQRYAAVPTFAIVLVHYHVTAHGRRPKQFFAFFLLRDSFRLDYDWQMQFTATSRKVARRPGARRTKKTSSVVYHDNMTKFKGLNAQADTSLRVLSDTFYYSGLFFVIQPRTDPSNWLYCRRRGLYRYTFGLRKTLPEMSRKLSPTILSWCGTSHERRYHFVLHVEKDVWSLLATSQLIYMLRLQ